jgi:hypothetical protein
MADAGTHAGRAPGIKGAKVKVLLNQKGEPTGASAQGTVA